MIAALQPLNGVLRPHAPDKGEPPSQARRAWEVLHRGCGWGMLVASAVQVALGLGLVYDDATRGALGAGYAACLAVALLVAGVGVVRSRRLQAGGPAVKEVGGEVLTPSESAAL